MIEGKRDFFPSKDRMYHFPHNTLFPEELDFLLTCIDPDRDSYTLKELLSVLLVEEIKQGVFKMFHSQLHSIVIDGKDVDESTIFRKFDQIAKTKRIPIGMPAELSQLIMKKGAKFATSVFLKERRDSFIEALKHLDDPETLLRVQYKPTKTLSQVWVEYVRDYVDFCAYCGLLPCYYKLPTQGSVNEGYVVSPYVKMMQDKKISIVDFLVHFKYSNSSINVHRYRQFHIRVRPYYCLLKILRELKKKGFALVERKLLFACVACLMDESEIPAAVEYIAGLRGKVPKWEVDFHKEIVRFSAGMYRFVLTTGLAENEKNGWLEYFKLTSAGETLVDKTPRNALYFGEYSGSVFYSSALAIVLQYCTNAVELGRQNFTLADIRRLIPSVNNEELLGLLSEVQELRPTPIANVAADVVTLNSFEHQYAVSPFVDFASVDEASAVFAGHTEERVIRPLLAPISPPKEIISEILAKSLASDGEAYEAVLEDAFNALSIGLVKRFGQASRFSRLSDLTWLVDYDVDGEKKKILCVIEAKAGNAIYAFREDKESEDMTNTILQYKNQFPDIYGIWVMVVDSDKLPKQGGHGGFRGAEGLQKSFNQKMMEVHKRLLSSFGKPVIVTAFSVHAFLEYYAYLYSIFHQHKLSEVNALVSEFYMKGSLFFNDYRYISVLSDESFVKRHLFV